MNQLKSNPINNGVSSDRRHLEARRCRKTRWRHPRTPLPVLFLVPFQREPGPTGERRFRLHRFHPRDRFESPGTDLSPREPGGRRGGLAGTVRGEPPCCTAGRGWANFRFRYGSRTGTEGDGRTQMRRGGILGGAGRLGEV